MTSYDSSGVGYSSNAKEILISTPITLSTYQIPKSCKTIRAGSVETSAFYSCRNNIKYISFEKDSIITNIESYAFSETSIVSADFSNCLSLVTIGNYVFYICKSLSNVILPPNLFTL